MHRRLALTAASAALAVLAAACGGSATAAPGVASPSVAASAAPSSSPAATAAAVASTAPVATGAVPSIALPNQDTNLEALLPSTFGGAKLQKLSIKGSQYLGQGSNSELNKAVADLGLTAADVSVAVAAAPAAENGVTFVAIRFAGADSGKLLQVFQAASQASGEVVSSANVGGKDVMKSTDTSGRVSYFYVRNDVALGVTAKDDKTAAAAIAVLP